MCVVPVSRGRFMTPSFYFVTCNSYLGMLTVRLLPQLQHDSNGFVFQQDVAPCVFHPWSWIFLVWAGDFVTCRWPSRSSAFKSGRQLVELLVYGSQVFGPASAAIFAGVEVENYSFMASLCTEFGKELDYVIDCCLVICRAHNWFLWDVWEILNVCWLLWMWYHSSIFASVPVWKSLVLFWPLCSWGLGMKLVTNFSTFGDWFSSWVWVHRKKW